ncbi:protein LATERAL BRANCHING OXIDOREDUCTASE 1 [Elaeis guineensis]|uniref:Uncharacterized protein LOC105040599 n=1 Tax=Elaeis guineensis var. tenera TaxID=51953 RepID=A0A6I9QUH3_ELAGV|nr:uncharacterized protein LOC105040599 [Elaeis guineensis]
MATSARDPPDHLPESRAPPPSPVAGSPTDGSESQEKDELTGFLTHSLHVPKLNLPDRIFPRNATPWNPPEINFQALVSPQNDGSAMELLKSTWSAFGCFQLVNHGIPRDLIATGEVAAAAAFRIPAEKKKATARSPEKRWGFELEEEEGGEEFLWYRSRMRDELAGIWAPGYEDFSDKIDGLWVEIEKLASTMGEILLQINGAGGAHMCSKRRREEEMEGSILCLHKHRRNDLDGGLKNEVLRMAVRSLDCLHSFCMHFCEGASEFHIYSKRGWFQFYPGKEAIIITIGNQIKACSGGLYKNVIGKPIFQDGGHHDSISISFLYSHPIRTYTRPTVRGEKTISLAQQVMIAACLILLCHIIIYLYGSI